MQHLIHRWIRPEIEAMSAYAVADATGMVKLDAMENPHNWPSGWPEGLRQSWEAALATADLNRYPDPHAVALTAELRQAWGVGAEWSLLLGNGSDEIIQLLAMALWGAGRTVLAPEPSFVMYRLIATFLGLNYCGVPLTAQFQLDRAAMLAAIEREQPALIFLACPNNPTGNLFDAADIHAILEAAPGLVVIDEAYHAFAGGYSWLPELKRYPNLLVMRTLSKLGLAGLRLGVLIGSEAWLTQINKVRLPYNINSLTQISARFALQHLAHFEAQCQQICEQRQWLFEALAALPEVEPFASQANFILFRVAGGGADAIHQSLKQQRVLIKNLNPQGGLLRDSLRVTVGLAAENRAFMAALQVALAEVGGRQMGGED